MKILIVRVSSLGDVVHNMPMLADILRHYPDARIDWVVEEAYTSLVRLNRGVRNIIPFALRRWRKSLLSKKTHAEMQTFYQTLRLESYDLVFDTQGLLKTGVVMRMARLAPDGRRVGLANATEGSGYEAISRIFHTESIPVDPRTHAVLRARVVAAAALGYKVDGPADFNLQTPDASHASWLPDQPYAVFFHGTARDAKRWDNACWIQVAHDLNARGMPVLLPWGSEQEKQVAQQLAACIKNAQVLPKLSMMDAVILAQRAALAIGVDTGLTHIAAAFNRPTIELYCDSPRWKTEGNWSPSIVNLGDLGMPPAAAQAEAAVTRLLGPKSDFPCRNVRTVHDGTNISFTGRPAARSRCESACHLDAADRTQADLMRLLYSAAWWLALPVVFIRLWWRGRKEPGYRQHLAERFGFYGKPSASSPLLWVHAVSVGETRAAEPLVEALLQAYPSYRILLTHMTPTGRATGQTLFGKHGSRVMQSYLPYDTGWMVGRFLRHFSPRLCILMETEVWPNVMAQCARYLYD